MEIDDILEEYGGYGRTGRVLFKHHAYVMVAKKFGLNWNEMNHNDKTVLKSEMIDRFTRMGNIREEYWKNLSKN